jgi:hypothetical protein
MTSTASTFEYIATDIPAGMTIDAYRRARPLTRSRWSPRSWFR